MLPRRMGDAAAPRALASIMHGLFPYSALGQEHVAAIEGGFLVANHRSNADAAVLYLTCGRGLAGPAKVELFRIPLLGHALRAVGAFPVDRDGMDHRAARAVLEAYRSGRLVLVFPEGHRGPAPGLLPFSPNLARLIIKLQAPIVPAGIAGTEDVLPPGRWLPRRKQVVVAYGEPFELSAFYGSPLTREDSERAAAIVQGRVAGALTRAEHQRATVRAYTRTRSSR